MPKVAIVSHDVQTVLNGRAGGVGAFVTHWARLLKQAGEDVTIILTRQEPFPVSIDPAWRARYESWGIHLIEIHNDLPSVDRWGDHWTLRLSEKVTPILRDFDILYFQDWANVAFHLARMKRFSPQPLPTLITVLHGPSMWERSGNQTYPHIPDDLHLDFIERYAAEHSDHVLAPSRYLLRWTQHNGWRYRSKPLSMGLPHLDPNPLPDTNTTPQLRNIIFFGRLETRKGLRILTDALLRLPDLWPSIESLILLGQEKESGALQQALAHLAPTGLRVEHISHLDSVGVRSYLQQGACDSLAIIPSPAENFPYAVIEASLIPGLNLLCSSGGGVPEVLGDAPQQLFDPHPAALADKIRERFAQPLAPSQLARYDWQSANRRWLHFHQSLAPTPKPKPVHTLPTLDVCLPYFNKTGYFGQLLASLEQQTHQDFRVLAVDDGSTLPEARQHFDDMSARYSPRGWTFLRQANAFADAARNRLAERSQADYLLFIDADDIVTPDAIEKLLHAAADSGLDCILSGGWLLENDRPDLHRTRFLPLGPNLVSGLFDPMVFGLSMILIRRSIFHAIGGFRELRGVAHEDWELIARLLLAGHSCDVLPEFLLHFRRLSDGLATISADFPAKQRLLSAYEEALSPIGLRGLASAAFAALRQHQPPTPPPPTPLARTQDRVREMMLRRARTGKPTV